MTDAELVPSCPFLSLVPVPAAADLVAARRVCDELDPVAESPMIPPLGRAASHFTKRG